MARRRACAAPSRRARRTTATDAAAFAPASAADESAPGGLGRLALLRGVVALGVGRPLSAVALQENGMALEAGRAAFVRLGFALLGPVVVDNH